MPANSENQRPASSAPEVNRKAGFRHLMVVHSYYPFDETRVQRQVEALADRSYEVDVVCLRHGGEPATEQAGGATVYRLPVRRDKKRGPAAQFLEYLAFFCLAFLKVTALHLRHRYASVQVHNLPDFLVFAALAPRLTGSRVILDLHDLMPEFFCSRFGGGMDALPVRLILLQERLACRFAHHVITVTESWRQTLIGRGLPAGKCTVVMNVADTRYLEPAGRPADPVEAPADAPPGAPFNLVYHGTLTERYGVDLALQAVARVRDEIPGVCLTIHGRGEYLEMVRALIAGLGLEEHVHLSTAFLPTADLFRLVSSADVGIVPYRRDIFTDGILPTKLMEYVALGVPVIAARTPAICAYFDERMVAFFEPGDVDDLAGALRRLYAGPGERRRLAASARRFSETYNWASVAETYTGLVGRLVGAGSRA